MQRLNRRLREDDSGIAGVIGVVLMLAVIVSAYANAVRTEIPAFGIASEQGWDDDVATTMRQFSRSLGDGLTAGAPMAMILPPQREPRGIDVPLVGRTEPMRATGTLAFAPACASITATHTLADGSSVNDLRAGSGGCLIFRSQLVYSDAFAYRVELGGILRVQGDRAVVLAGPPLELDASTPSEYRAALGVPGLRGHAMTVGAQNGVRVDLVPGPYSGEIEQAPNAGAATWRLSTSFPEAWKTWFETRFEDSGFVSSRASPGPGQSSSDYSIVCIPADCSRGADGKGEVEVRIEGPRTDTDDLKLAVTYAIFDVNLR